MAENTASIPGDGNTPVTFTHSSDVGRFVAAIVDIDKWDRISVIVGDKMALNEAVKLAEAVKGKRHCLGTKFNVIYDDIDDLKKGRLTELPSQAALYGALPAGFLQALGSRFGVWVARGDLDLDESTSLNKSLPDLDTIKLKDFLQKAWGLG
ncbi:uncharacterized protein E0L32_004637 [Thyridium curvatum]|uniref:NmrA-like domain-containing protein n=1 Tax=Thyridium curvatum TaxID=1093900 RepID=A0A507BFN4_9PEZI|nr:uncharacterized protein E0L32_004637 [Thyridium curvatum]TPX15360.1 hypothetical protein E0L32_004637 [Thyridium curvatum]